MKKQTIKGFAFIALAGTMVTSCDLLKDLEYTVTPNPLEMHGDSVRVKVDIKFPEKGIRKKASAEITPMLGSTALKSVTVQGEKATGNGNVIQFKPGGNVSYNDVVVYKSEYENTDLKVTGTVSKGGKVKKQLGEIKIADATIVTPFMVNKDYKVIFEKDAFNRITEESTSAQVNYEKSKSVVRPTELKEKDIAQLQAWLSKAQADPKISLKTISITGYASPEGETGKNSSLSTERAEAGKTTVINLAKAAKNVKAQTEIFSLNGRGEDYDGFKRELEKSTMNNDEKQLVIRVLEMHKDPETRETEMRNMGKTFKYLDDNIFPKLRRAEITVTYDKTGYTDEELKTISLSKPETLKIEELLFAATLTNDLNEKLSIFNAAIKVAPEDVRAYNNAGAIFFLQNKMPEAKEQFEKANSINENAVSKNNLAAVAGVSGDKEKAKQLLAQAKGAGSEVNYNMGIVNIIEGNYNDALSNLGSENTFNKALALVLSGSFDQASAAIDGSKDKETAQGYYIKAIVGARTNKPDVAISNLKNAIAKDSSLKAKAAKDREFIKLFQDANFSAIVK
jgi:tetratricopeptide (TPR) repeat protein